MKKVSFIFFGVLIISFSSNLFAQGETAVPFMRINPSPNLNGMAGAFTALPTNDVYGSFYNPAQLGNFSRDKNFSIGFFSEKTNWLPQFNFSDLNLHALVVAGGYKLNTDIPISLGFSFMYEKLDLGENVWTDATGNELGVFNSFETFHALSAGIGLDYGLRYNFGLTVKYINSELVPMNIVRVGSEYRDGPVKTGAMDIGFQIVWPVISTINSLSEKFTSDYKPFLNVSTGYSINNIGDEITYMSKAKSDPLPREARLGYGISLGLETELFEDNFNLIKIDISSEARDILVERNPDNFNYQGILGDIDFIENVISGLCDEKVYVYQGWRVKFLDTFQYSKGRFKGPGYFEIQKTSGISVSLSGIFKLLNHNNKIQGFEFLAKHVDFQYSHSKYSVKNSPLDETEFKGIQISLFGF